MANSAGTMPNTGRWGWYRDHEGREWRRVSTLIRKVDTNTSALDAWKKRQVLLGAARRDDIILGVKALGAPDPVLGWNEPTKKKLNAWAEDCMTAAGSSAGATEGTAMHDLTERVDRGEPIDQVAAGLPGPAAASLRAYAKLRELNGWRSVEIERTVVCDELEVAGSFDRIDVIPGLAALLGPGMCQHGHAQYEWHDDLPVIVDVKTEKDPLLNGLHIGPQLAIYSRARRMWIPGPANVTVTPASGGTTITGSYVDAPCVRQDVAIVVHVRDGKAIPYFVDLTAGWEAAQAAARQLQREKEAKKWFAPVPGIVEPKPAEVLTDVAVAAQYADPNRTSLAAAMLDASKVTATVLGPAPMPNLEPATLDLTSRPPGAYPLGVMPSATVGHDVTASADAIGVQRGYRVGDTVTVGGIEFVKHTEWPGAAQVTEQTATRGADGLVRWESAKERESNGIGSQLDGALYGIRKAETLEDLAHVYEVWTGRLGNSWAGQVAEAGEARRRIIECPQRALHTSGKCSCGWIDI